MHGTYQKQTQLQIHLQILHLLGCRLNWKAHSARGSSATTAFNKGVTIANIFKAADWTTDSILLLPTKSFWILLSVTRARGASMASTAKAVQLFRLYANKNLTSSAHADDTHEGMLQPRWRTGSPWLLDRCDEEAGMEEKSSPTFDL